MEIVNDDDDEGRRRRKPTAVQKIHKNKEIGHF
jgi:hypothetical protein